MALPTTRMLGGRYQLREGGSPTTLGGGRNATLEISRDDISTFLSTSAGWAESIPSVSRWNLSGDLEYLSDGSTPLKGCTADITIAAVGILELTRWSLTCAVSFAEAVTSDSSCAVIRTPFMREVTLDFDALLVDTLNASAQAAQDIEQYVNGASDTTLAVVATLVSGHTLSFNGNPSTFRIAADPTDHAILSGTLKANGAVTGVFTNSDVGLKVLLDSMFVADVANLSTTAVYFANVVDNIGATLYSGSAYPGNVTFDVDYEQKVSISLVMQGSGALTIAAAA